MQIRPIALINGTAILSIALYVGSSIGLTLPGAAVFAVLVVVPFTWLEVLCGLKALVLPMSGLAFGLLAVLVIQLLSGGASVGLSYYLFGPALSLCAFFLVGSVLLLAAPKLRARMFPQRTSARHG